MNIICQRFFRSFRSRLRAAICLTATLAALTGAALAQLPGDPAPGGKPPTKGSVLIYNFYASDALNPTLENTTIELTNNHPTAAAIVHLYFIEGSSGVPADIFFCLAPDETFSFLASDYDPGNKGYLVAFSNDSNGVLNNFNFLSGSAAVKLASGHHAEFDALTLTQSPAGPYPLGTTNVMLTVTDGRGGSSTCNATVTVVDATPPTLTLTGNQIALWPPNHQDETISVAQLVASARANCGGNLTASVVSAQVSSDEPEDAPGGGDGNTLNDIVVAADCKSVQLHAERQGSGNGRVCTITFKVRDAAGNLATATAKVTVPKNQGGAAAVDDGASYTVISGCP
jgi:hypothetical protein